MDANAAGNAAHASPWIDDSNSELSWDRRPRSCKQSKPQRPCLPARQSPPTQPTRPPFVCRKAGNGWQGPGRWRKAPWGRRTSVQSAPGPRKVVQSVRRVTQLPAAAAHTPRLGLKRTPFCGSGRPDFRATVYVRSPFRLDRAS